MLDCLIQLHDYTNMFLPDSLRRFFSLIPAPNERGQFLETLLDKFSDRYLECNHQVAMAKGIVYCKEVVRARVLFLE